MSRSTVPLLRSAAVTLGAALAIAACKGNVQPSYTASDAANGAPGAATNGVAPANAPGQGGNVTGVGSPGRGGAMSDTGRGALAPAAGMAGPPNATGTTGGMSSGTAAATVPQRAGSSARKTP